MVEWLRGDDPLCGDPVRPRRCSDGLRRGGRARLEAVGRRARARLSLTCWPRRTAAARRTRSAPSRPGWTSRPKRAAWRLRRVTTRTASWRCPVRRRCSSRFPRCAAGPSPPPGSRRLATSRLTHGGLPLPRVLVTAEDVERGKPDPQPYLAAAAALGVEPSRCLVVEDAPAGIAAGKAAGAAVLAVTTTFSQRQSRRRRLPWRPRSRRCVCVRRATATSSSSR